MNQFGEYVRSAAFRLDLSPLMINALLEVAGHDKDKRLVHSPYSALMRRGLVKLRSVDHGGLVLTEAGECVVKLLVIAGFANESNLARQIGE